MADLLDAINFLEIQNTKGGNRNEARLRDLEGRAQYLSKKTGQEPVSWYEFTRAVPPEKPNTISNAVIGAGIGAVVLGGITIALAAAAAPAAIVSGLVLGGLLGGYHKTENTSRAHQVDEYERYLMQFEAAQGLGIRKEHGNLSAEHHHAPVKTHHAETLKAERETQKEAHCGCKGK